MPKNPEDIPLGTPPMEPQKKPTCRKLFVERMKREGRGKEFFQKLREVQKTTGLRFHQASYAVMREMGYQGPQVERALYEEYQKTVHKTKVEAEVDQAKVEIREERKIENFEDAVRTLPDKAPVSVEIDWIRAHPAMCRIARAKDKTKTIVITAEDILQAPHGAAPSKSAVYALQHWANQPGEFFKQLLGEQKKKTDMEDGAGKTEADTDFAEIEALLQEVTGGTGVVD